MPDTDNGPIGLPDPSNDVTEPGLGSLHISEKSEEQKPDPTIFTDAKPTTAVSTQSAERPGTVEHLAARRPTAEIDATSPEIKEQLVALRASITRLLTSLRWEDLAVDKAADELTPMLNVGSVQQWKSVLLPFLLEIDRAGNLIPVWLKIIERGDPPDLPRDANPANTMEGRARRFAILMLGYYKTVEIGDQKPLGFGKGASAKAADVTKILGKLVTDPNTSLYASQSLVRLATTAAMQALVSALKDAEGWAKVDVVEGCLAFQQEKFYDLLLASGLDRAPGLESYIAIPIYRTIPLERYLRDTNSESPRLAQQAALVVNHVLQDGAKPPRGEVQTLPIAFEQPLPALAQALFEGARNHPMWQNTVAVHRLATFLGQYWSGISRGEVSDQRIVEPVYQCLPMMSEVERWIAGPGRDVLLATIADPGEDSLLPTTRVLGELREPRAISPLIEYINKATSLNSHAQALTLAAICDTLGRLGDRRASQPLQQFALRVIDINRRSATAKRRDNLPSGDPNIPGSIVYAAVVRASGLLGDRSALDLILRAINDFDPYVRTQSIEALKRLDPVGDDTRSRVAARDALQDPRDSVVRAATQLVLQYRDLDATSSLRTIIETRPELAAAAYDALRHLGQ